VLPEAGRMKMRHKINHEWMPPVSPLRSDPVDNSYAAEVETALRRAEKALRRAQKQLEAAE
jgi:hypothetical protein